MSKESLLNSGIVVSIAIIAMFVAAELLRAHIEARVGRSPACSLRWRPASSCRPGR